MSNNDLILNPVASPFDKPLFSEDGYIRLTLAQLACVQLHHLHSSLYPEAPLDGNLSCSLTNIQGLTEWYSHTQPSISIGWDWQVNYNSGVTGYSMVGLPYSNIRLQNSQYQDLSEDESLAMLAVWINSLHWQEVIFQHIQLQYQ